MSDKVLIASDHGGYELKAKIQKELPAYEWEDLGPFDCDAKDYPVFAEKLARKVATELGVMGILICGSGIGMSMAANKVKGVRAALCWNTESAKLSRQHNHANVLCIGARLIAEKHAIEIVKVWLETAQDPALRHTRRINLITKIENS